MKEEVLGLHRGIYGGEAEVYSAPGRVNLIGEHTDYNDGYVLPTPIDRRIWVAASPRRDEKVRVHAADFDESTEFSLRGIRRDPRHGWVNYVQGVAKALMDEGYSLGGTDMVVKGDVPLGAGLSSSAALLMSTMRVFQGLNSIEIDPVEAAYLGRKAENEFVGVQCGVMDQFVAGLGEHGKALFIDCRTNEHRLIPLRDEYRVVIVNTMKNRELTDSAYNERRAQCEEAVRIISAGHPEVEALRDVSPEMLIESWGMLPETIQSRARHVVTENQRVLEAAEYLARGDAEGFGDLMYDSHESLRYDYEVSCRELDALVGATMDMDEVVGARMTGAGFGGCTVNLVEAGYVGEFAETIKKRYLRSTAKRAEVYLA
ncbi:galactokinase [Candidatus Bathyarchaeota archaeon]|nr:galactokinase [Candidatus Bathyarchaeota archaeon]